MDPVEQLEHVARRHTTQHRKLGDRHAPERELDEHVALARRRCCVGRWRRGRRRSGTGRWREAMLELVGATDAWLSSWHARASPSPPSLSAVSFLWCEELFLAAQRGRPAE